MTARAVAVAGIALAVVAAAGYGVYTLGMNQGMKMASPAATPAKGATTADASGRRVLYWHDPMVPGQRFDKPGKSPFMDMQLVPVYADSAASSGVRVSAAVQQNLGIRYATVRRATMSSSLPSPSGSGRSIWGA